LKRGCLAFELREPALDRRESRGMAGREPKRLLHHDDPRKARDEHPDARCGKRREGRRIPPGGHSNKEHPPTWHQGLLFSALSLRRPRRRLETGSTSTRPDAALGDDHPENNDFLAALVGDAGIDVTTALDTDSALRRARRDDFDMTVTNMGRGTDATAGLKLLERLREDGKQHRTLVFASPSAIAEHADEATRLGAIECTAGAVRLLEAIAEHLPL
jgi:CheY-like chemotaxis protein